MSSHKNVISIITQELKFYYRDRPDVFMVIKFLLWAHFSTVRIMVLITVQFYKPYGDYGFNHRTVYSDYGFNHCIVYSDYGLGRILRKNFPNMQRKTST